MDYERLHFCQIFIKILWYGAWFDFFWYGLFNCLNNCTSLLFSFAKKEDINDFWLAQGLNEAIPLLQVSSTVSAFWLRVVKNRNRSNHSKWKQANILKRGKTRVIKSRLAIGLKLIGWETGARFLDQSHSEVKKKQINLGLRSTQLKTALSYF